MNSSFKVARPDFALIAAWVKPGSKVLDLGCGDGSLIRFLRDSRGSRGYGVEIDDVNVLACFNNGVNVIQSDLESGLTHAAIRAKSGRATLNDEFMAGDFVIRQCYPCKPAPACDNADPP